jgi:hypothetical protein
VRGDQSSYAYASGDLLEQRNTYFYSEYGGLAFLEAWRRQRADAIREISETSRQTARCEGACSPSRNTTDILLESIYQHLESKSNLDEHLSLLDRLVQRFEVTKRLHGDYDENWRPVDPNDYRVLERYVRFAEALDLGYECTRELTYLNALLKTLDSLTALRAALSTQQRRRLKALIEHERDHIERLGSHLARKSNAA